MPTKKLTLFHYWRSSCSWRVRWALAAKEIPYETKAVNLLEAEHQSKDYKRLNPSGQVPCLKIGEHYISESLAIIEWLDETFPEPRLIPGNPWKKLEVRSLAYKIASGIQPIQNLSVMRKHHRERDEQLRWSRYWIEKGFLAVEKILEGTATRFACGSEVTLADLCLVPQVYNAKRFSVDLNHFPKIERVYENCLETKACQEAHPDSFQKEALKKCS